MVSSMLKWRVTLDEHYHQNVCVRMFWGYSMVTSNPQVWVIYHQPNVFPTHTTCPIWLAGTLLHTVTEVLPSCNCTTGYVLLDFLCSVLDTHHFCLGSLLTTSYVAMLNSKEWGKYWVSIIASSLLHHCVFSDSIILSGSILFIF